MICPSCNQPCAACDAEGLATARHHALARVIAERNQALAALNVAADERLTLKMEARTAADKIRASHVVIQTLKIALERARDQAHAARDAGR